MKQVSFQAISTDQLWEWKTWIKIEVWNKAIFPLHLPIFNMASIKQQTQRDETGVCENAWNTRRENPNILEMKHFAIFFVDVVLMCTGIVVKHTMTRVIL